MDPESLAEIENVDPNSNENETYVDEEISQPLESLEVASGDQNGEVNDEVQVNGQNVNGDAHTSPEGELEDEGMLNDEGVEFDEDYSRDDSKTKDDTYSSSRSDSLIDNVDSTTSVDETTTVAPPETVMTPPASEQGQQQRYTSPMSPESQRVSKSPASSTSTNSSKKRSSLSKRKSNDFKPTVVKPFSFTMDKRLEDRQKYNEKVKKMQKAQEERERLERERQEKEEEEKLKMDRKKTIPKANPIRYYKPITITPSKKPLTMPEAPKLCLENRNRMPKVADSNTRGGNKLKQVL